MLVCNVSMRPPRRAIAADIAETAAADDASTTGQVVFATLVDDPASVADVLDAYLGEIMVEAASAGDTCSAGSSHAGDVDEDATAADTPDATIGGAAAARQAMVAGPSPVFINSNTSRQAYIDSVMINQ